MNYSRSRQTASGQAFSSEDQVHHTPPADQQAAAEYARRQIAKVYGDNTETNAPPSYAHNYNQEAPIDPQQHYDWQTYHQAWQNYYQQYYQRYYMGQGQQFPGPQADDHLTDDGLDVDLQAAATTHHAEVETQEQGIAGPQTPLQARLAAAKQLHDKLRQHVAERAQKAKASPHFMPLVTALVVGMLFLFLQFNRTIIAQAKYYISPGTVAGDGSGIIINPQTVANVGNEPRIIIPKINVDVPVVYDETSYDEAKIQKALERGVVHYGTTAVPGQLGNNVIVGHSSNDLFDAGGYKFAFVLIDRLENGDVFMLNYQGKRYVYKVYHKQVIDPTDFSLINITPDKPVVTLITCTPPGTALKRLVVQAEQISPEPNADQVANKPTNTSSRPATMPGNSPTFLDRMGDVFQ